MRRVEEKQVISVERQVTSVTCNRCGRTFTPTADQPWWDAAVHEIRVSFGYGSRHDGETWLFDLCEECLLTIIREFRIVPDGFFGNRCAELERRQAAFEQWKETGEWDPQLALADEESKAEGCSPRQPRA